MSHIFTEAKLEQAIITLLGQHLNAAGQPCYPHYVGSDVPRKDKNEVLIADDLRQYLARQYQADGITEGEIATILHQLQTLPASALYQSNKTFCHWLSNGFLLKREDRDQKDLYIELMNTHALPSQLASLFVGQEEVTAEADHNIYRVVNQLEIEGQTRDGGLQLRIPDAILYVNGLPLVVFEFKSAVRGEEATTYDAWSYCQIWCME